MSRYELKNANNAPSPSDAALDQAQRSLGFTPNLYRALANSPVALTAYTSLAETIGRHTTLSAAEQQVAYITASIVNGCFYCVAAHSTIAGGQAIDSAIIDAVREQTPLADDRQEAVRVVTRKLINRRGWLEEEDLHTAEAAGLQRSEVLDLVTIVALKTISNYTNHLVETPLDDAFQASRFEPAA